MKKILLFILLTNAAFGQVTGIQSNISGAYIPLSGTSSIAGNLIPTTNDTYDLGSTSFYFRRLHASTVYTAVLRNSGSGGITFYSSSGGVLGKIYENSNLVWGTSSPTDAGFKFDLQGSARFTGKLTFDATFTASGTTGAQTINKPSGSVNIAAGQSSITVTNSFATTTSIIIAVILSNDTTAQIKNVVRSSGSFTVNLVSSATAETPIGFIIH